MKPLSQIGNITTLLANSSIAESPLWNKPVDHIGKYNLAAFLAGMNVCRRSDEANADVAKMLHELHRLHDVGELPEIELLSYKPPRQPLRITSQQFIDGLAVMSRPYAVATLFGVETEWDAELVVTLKWKQVNILDFSETAQLCIQRQPRHLWCEYVFWQEQGDKTVPVHGLEQVVFNVFGLTWGELLEATGNMIIVENVSLQQ